MTTNKSFPTNLIEQVTDPARSGSPKIAWDNPLDTNLLRSGEEIALVKDLPRGDRANQHVYSMQYLGQLFDAIVDVCFMDNNVVLPILDNYRLG